MKTTMLTTDEVLARLAEFKARRQAAYRLKAIGIFGSFARGEADERSDVDIVFETDAPNLFRTVEMKAELEELLDTPVDVVRLREHMNPRLRDRILREARYA